ncbi:TPA: phage terminase large subunit family protein [Escherichia coli]|nr:phage terminase large subunit family protein [Escherichia coli]
MGFSSARNLGRDISAGFSPPRRMPISEAVKKFMRVPKGAGNSVPWDPELTPYIIEPMNCLASREYDAVIFVGPARTGKTIGLIDGWIVYTIVCDPSDIASFWMEGPAAAYQTWAQLVYKLLTAEQEYEATGSEETLRAVINTDWGLPYLPRASMEQRKSELLEQRAEPVPSRSVPDGVNFLVATVDVQAGRHRRFVVQVTGYGSRGERWIIDRYNITQSLRGDSDGESQRIDPASYPEDWDVLLTDVFHKSWPLASDPSQQMRLMAMAVDSGGEDGVTDNAYKFWRRCRRDGLGKRIYLFKGDSIRRAKLITRTFPDNTGRTGRRAQAAGDVPLWLLQTDALKDRVNNALWRDSPGPGYVHFPDWLGSWFYDELTYEERSSDGKWSKPGRGANEAFDLMVYAEALVILHGYEKIRWPDAPEWASRETWLECVPDSTEPSPSPEPVSTPVKKQKRKKTVTDDVNPWLTSGGWL